MIQQIADTTRNTVGDTSHLIEIVPRSQRVASPRGDKSLERRTKPIPRALVEKLLVPQNNQEQSMNQPPPAQLQSSELQIQRRVYQQFKNDLTKYIQQNARLKAQNLILIEKGQVLRQGFSGGRGTEEQRQSINQSMESYYTRIKTLQDHISLCQLQSQANIIYSQCLLRISKCLSQQQLTITQLRSQIVNLMLECESYKQEIQRLGESNHIKEYSMNQQLQKIILQFNQALFAKNDLQIKIFDLTTGSNSLQAEISDLNCRIEQLEFEAKKHSSSNSRVTHSRLIPKTENPLQQLKITLQNVERENQHLRQEVESYIVKLNNSNRSQMGSKMEIARLNSFIAELNTKWNVEFEHNNTLQQQRSASIKELARLGIELQKANFKTEESNRVVDRIRVEHDNVIKEKRQSELELELSVFNLNKEREVNETLRSQNQSLEREVVALSLQNKRDQERMQELIKSSQNKENTYLEELNSLRGQIHSLQNQIYQSNNTLISKQEEMRALSQELTVNNSHTVQFIKNQSRLQLQLQKNHIQMLNQKIAELEQKIFSIHQQNLNSQSQLGSNKILIFDLENMLRVKTVEFEESLQRVESMFHLERETLVHTKGLVESELELAQQQIKELRAEMSSLKSSQLLEYEGIIINNQALSKEVEQSQFVIESLNSRLRFQEEVEIERNKYQTECNRLEIELDNRRVEIQQFIKSTNDEQALRKQSYQEQIETLHRIIEANDHEMNNLKREYQSNISSMMRNESQFKGILLIKEQAAHQSNKRMEESTVMIQEFRAKVSSELQMIRQEILGKINLEYSKNMSLEIDIIIRNYQQRLLAINGEISTLINKRGLNLTSQILNQLHTIKHYSMNNLNIDHPDSIDNWQRLNSNKLSDLESHMKSVESLVRRMSGEIVSELNIARQNHVDLQLRTQELQGLKHANKGLAQALSASQQTLLTLKNQISSSLLRYDHLKSESQLESDRHSQQIRQFKITVSELEKCNHQLLTKLSFAEHDRTIERLNSMPDLNRSLQSHRSRVEINVGTEKEIRGRDNPEILVVEDGQTVVKGRNQVIEGFGGTQVIVNIIQKQTQSKNVTQPQSPRVNRKGNQKLETFGVLPYVLNQEPNSPTHRVCFAARRRSRSPPTVIPSNIQMIKRRDQQKEESRFINEEEQFIVRDHTKRIKQIPYISLSKNEMQPRLKPTSPPINRIETIKSSSSQPIIHYPDSVFAKDQQMNTGILHSNSQICTQLEREVNGGNNGSSGIRY